MASLLVVEDDPTIGSVLQSTLTAQGHRVAWATTGGAALTFVADAEFDLALLDLGLPDMDGVEVCRRIRGLLPGCVLVVLTARDEEIDVVVGLEAGADDYLTKPFRLAELSARVKAHLRRGAGGDATGSEPQVTVGELRVDQAARRAYLGDIEITLRAKEFDLLARLTSQPGVAISRTDLMADVWDEHWFGSTKTLDVHVAALRRKLAAAGLQGGRTPPEIMTLRARGYRLERPPG